jgi:hypothetical protein
MTLPAALSGFGLLEDLLDLGDVGVVLRLLLVVHLDRERLDDRPRQLEADLGGGAKLAVA